MVTWRERLLNEAQEAGLLSQSEAAAIERRGFGDNDFIDAVFGSTNTSDAEIAALEARVRPGLLSGLSDSGGTGGQDEPSVTSGDALLPGLSPDFSLVGLHGEGGMAQVYEGIEIALNRRVAIKVPKNRAGGHDLAALLDRERNVVKDLDHPNIVVVYRAGQLADGRPYYVMPLIDGAVLKEWAIAQRRDSREIVMLMERVARAMGTAHLLHVVHRDLTPRNIMVTRDGEPKILDFGLAVTRGDDALYGLVIGTRGYMSPEQRCGQAIGPQSDVYSLGVILAELLTKSVLPVHPQPTESVSATTDEADIGLRRIAPHVKRDLRAIVEKCCVQDPTARYPTGTELADDLRRWLSHRAVQAHLDTSIRPFYQMGKFARRQPLLTMSLALLAVVSLLAFAVTDRQRRIARGAAEQEAMARGEAERQTAIARAQRDRAETELMRDGINTVNRLVHAGRVDEVERIFWRVPPSRRSWECFRMQYEADIAPRPQRVLDGHDGRILASLVSPGGRWLVTAGEDGRLRAFNMIEDQVVELAEGRWSDRRRTYVPAWQNSFASPDADSTGCYVDLAWLVAGSELIAVGAGGRAALFTLPDPNERTLYQSDKELTAVAVAPEGAILLGDVDGGLTLVNRDGKVTASRELSGGSITDIVSVAGTWCAGRADGSVGILSPQLDQEFGKLSEPSPVYDVDFNVASGRLAIAAGSPTVAIVQLTEDNTLASRQTIPLPPAEENLPSAVHAVRWSADGNRLFGADDRGRLICWDTDTWTVQFARADQWPGWQRSESHRASVPARATCGIDVVDQADLAYTTGRDGTIKQWTLIRSDGIRRRNIGPQPQIALSDDGESLWSLSGDGKLSLWDTATLKQYSSVQANDKTAHDAYHVLAAAVDGSMVATAAGRRVRFWRWDGEGIQSTALEIAAPADVLALAVDSNAGHAAAYLSGDTLAVWSLTDGALTARRSLVAAGLGAARGALLAYNADGSRLAAAGPHSPLTILDTTRSLAVIERPNAMFVGGGGTAVAWDPLNEARFAGGDMAGRVHIHPEIVWEQSAERVFDNRPVAAVTFTPDGRRVMAASQNGLIAAIDPDGPGVIWTRQAGQQSPVNAISCDRRGRFLVIAHTDGMLELWDAAALDLPRAVPARAWRSLHLLGGQQASDVRFQSASVALDPKGRPLVVFSRRTPGSGADETAPYEVRVGQLQEDRLVHVPIETTSPLTLREKHSLRRSLACATIDDRVIAAARRPRNDLVAGLGQLIVHELALPLRRKTGTPEPIVRPANVGGQAATSLGNAGFATWLFPDVDDSLTALHFSHQGHYLLASRRAAGSWKTETVGRQGDGLHMAACRAQDGLLYACFSPTRYNGDPLPAVCLALDSKTLLTRYREMPDLLGGVIVYSVTVNHQGQPALLFRRRGADGTYQLAVAQRQGDHDWHVETVAVDPFTQLGPSNLLCDESGQLHLAVLDRSANKLYWLSRTSDGWTRELVQEIPTDAVDDDGVWIHPVAQLGPGDRPLILLGSESMTRGWLEFFELAE